MTLETLDVVARPQLEVPRVRTILKIGKLHMTENSEFGFDNWDSTPVGASPDELLPASKSDEVQRVLSPTQIRILSFCEQTFWETGLLPTPERVVEDLSVSGNSVRSTFRDEVFIQALASKGIDSEGLITVGALVKQSRALSPQQIVCANMMLNLHDKRSEREKLALIGVSSQQYHAWLRQPQFQEFLRKRGEALFSSSDYKAYKSLVRNVEAGDNKSLELFFRMRGIYRPTVDVNLNIEAVLTRVIEVISTHVKDPKILNAIANGIDEVLEAEEVA